MYQASRQRLLSGNKKEKVSMAKIIITQSIFWAAAIISTALVAPNESGWLILTVLATLSLGTLKNGIDSIQK
jgi:hypothetical protein